MEVDKVADEVTDMEVDKVDEMRSAIQDVICDWVKIQLEDF